LLFLTTKKQPAGGRCAARAMRSMQAIATKHAHDRSQPSDRIAALKRKIRRGISGRAHFAIFNLPSKPICGSESSQIITFPSPSRCGPRGSRRLVDGETYRFPRSAGRDFLKQFQHFSADRKFGRSKPSSHSRRVAAASQPTGYRPLCLSAVVAPARAWGPRLRVRQVAARRVQSHRRLGGPSHRR
jgi:hypothetical protein